MLLPWPRFEDAPLSLYQKLEDPSLSLRPIEAEHNGDDEPRRATSVDGKVDACIVSRDGCGAFPEFRAEANLEMVRAEVLLWP